MPKVWTQAKVITLEKPGANALTVLLQRILPDAEEIYNKVSDVGAAPVISKI